MRQQIAAYPQRISRRGLSGKDELELGRTIAKRHKKYVHGKVGQAMLLHKVAQLELHWYEYTMEYMVRRHSPRMIVRTNCGLTFFLEPGRATTCDIPREGTVLCATCHGEGRNFKHGVPPKVTKQQARASLGCAGIGMVTA